VNKHDAPGSVAYEGTHFTTARHLWSFYQKPKSATYQFLSLETIEWAAEHAYPYLGLGTSWYDGRASGQAMANAPRSLATSGSGELRLLTMASVADTERRPAPFSYTVANGNGSFARPGYTLPAGFNSPRRSSGWPNAQLGLAWR